MKLTLVISKCDIASINDLAVMIPGSLMLLIKKAHLKVRLI